MPSSKRKAPSESTTATKKEKKAPAVADEEVSPFPTFAHPTEAEARTVHAALATLHPEMLDLCSPKEDEVDEGSCSRKEVLDSLVGTIFSQNTTDVQSHKAFAALKQAFPTWEQVRTSDPGPIVETIRSCGLAEIKTERVQLILEALKEERGECSLEYLRDESDAAVKAALRRFKGVGAKTISCVLMFCLKRAEFPVDTHVWKIALALGWVPKGANRDQTYEHLNLCVPNEIKYALHVLLVKHGKVYKNDIKVLREQMRTLAALEQEHPPVKEEAPTPSNYSAVKHELEEPETKAKVQVCD